MIISSQQDEIQIEKCNYDLDKASSLRNFQPNEIKAIWNEAYENSHLSKVKMKIFHDKNILIKSFEPSQKNMLYNPRLLWFPGKLRSRRTVNGQRPKPFFEMFIPEDETITLEDHIYQNHCLKGPCIYILFVFFFLTFERNPIL